MDIRYDSVKSNTVFYFYGCCYNLLLGDFFKKFPCIFSNKMYNRTIHYLKSKVRWLFNENNFSGIQPSGTPTIGNYIAMKQFIELQMNTIVIFVLWMNMPLPFPKNRKSYASKFVV